MRETAILPAVIKGGRALPRLFRDLQSPPGAMRQHAALLVFLTRLLLAAPWQVHVHGAAHTTPPRSAHTIRPRAVVAVASGISPAMEEKLRALAKPQATESSIAGENSQDAQSIVQLRTIADLTVASHPASGLCIIRYVAPW